MQVEEQQILDLISKLKKILSDRQKPSTKNQALQYEAESLFCVYLVEMAKSKYECKYDESIVDKVERVLKIIEQSEKEELDSDNSILQELYP